MIREGVVLSPFRFHGRVLIVPGSMYISCVLRIRCHPSATICVHRALESYPSKGWVITLLCRRRCSTIVFDGSVKGIHNPSAYQVPRQLFHATQHSLAWGQAFPVVYGKATEVRRQTSVLRSVA